MKSEFLKLNLKDLGKGSIVVVLTAIVTALIAIIQAGRVPDTAEIKGIIIASLSAGTAYFFKNLFTNSNDEIAKPEVTESDESKDTIS